MKVIFQIITSVSPGGAENIAFSVSEFLLSASKDYKPVLFELYQTDSSYATEKKRLLQEKGIAVHTLGNKNKYLSLLIAPFRLKQFIRFQQPVIIHSHTDLPDFVLSMAMRLPGKIKSVITRTIHNTELWPTHHRLGKITEQSFQNDQIVAVSDAALMAYRALRKKYKLHPSDHQQVIYNGIKIPVTNKLPFSLDDGKMNIAFAGRLELQKGIDLLLQLIQQLPAALQSVFTFHIIGDGSFKKEVEAVCNQVSYCKYYGVINQLSEKLSAFDYVIMPSRHEGLVLLSLEASFAKVPVIATNIPGLKETLPTDWPLLATNTDIHSLLTILQRIANQEINRADLQAQAFHFVSTHFSYEQMGVAYLSLFNQITV